MIKTVAVIFGGKTCEHDISVITAVQTMGHMQKYNVVPILVTQEGEWLYSSSLKTVPAVAAVNPKKCKSVHLRPADKKLYHKNKPLCTLDAVLVAMHGLNGEDGAISALCELSGIPYTACSLTASAVSMDKIAMKLAFSGLGLPVLPYVFVDKLSYLDRDLRVKFEAEVQSKLVFPLIVKPSNLGSSIGISLVHSMAELSLALEVAFHFDNRVLVENAVSDRMEYNCSALGRGSSYRISAVEQPYGVDELLSFDDKYLRGAKPKSGGGMSGLVRRLPAPISKKLTKEIMELTSRIFTGLDCKGVVRVDYLYDNAKKELYVNEINAIPGSLSFYLWEYSGVSFEELITKLLAIAEEDFEAKQSLTYAYRSNVLSGSVGGAKTTEA